MTAYYAIKIISNKLTFLISFVPKHISNQSLTQAQRGRHCFTIGTHGMPSQNPIQVGRRNWVPIKANRESCTPLPKAVETGMGLTTGSTALLCDIH